MKFSSVWRMSLFLSVIVALAVPSIRLAAVTVTTPVVGFSIISETDVPIEGGLANAFILVGMKKENCLLGPDEKYVEATAKQREAFIAAFGAQKIEDEVANLKKLSGNPDVTVLFLFVREKAKDKAKP